MAQKNFGLNATALRFFVMLLLATMLCFCAVGCSAGSSQAAASNSAASSQVASADAASSQAAASADTASSQAASADAAADTSEIDLSDPTLLTDLDEFKFEAVKVYTPKKFELDVDPDANVVDYEMWRVSPYIAFLISRKPLSDYADIAAELEAEQAVQGLLSDEEAFQKFVLESVASRRTDTVTDSINGRWYQTYINGDKSYNVWTVLINDENSYWINFLCPLEEKDRYHDLMVQLIDKAEIDRG